MADEKIIFEVEFDDAAADEKMKALLKTSIELKAERQALDKAYKDGNLSMQQYADKLADNAKATEVNAKATKDLKKDMDLATAGRKLATDSVNQMKARVAQLTAQYNALSKEERENTAEGKKLSSVIKGLNSDIRDAAEATGKQGLAGAFKDAIAENTQFGKSVQTVGAAVKANPIGLLVSVIASLVGILKESKPFMDFFEGAMSRINAVVDIAKDRFFTFATGVKELFSGNFAKAAEIFKASIAGIGDELSREIELAGNLSKARQQLERDQINNIAVSKAMIAQEEKLKNIRDNEFNSIQERIKANEQAASIEQNRLKLQEQLAQRNVDIINQEIERRGGLAKATNDQVRVLREAQLELADIQEEAAGRENEFITNRFQLQKEASEKGIELAKERAAAEQSAREQQLLGSITELEKHEATILELKTKAEEQLTAAAAKGIEDRKKYDQIYLAEQNRIAQEEIMIQQAKVDTIVGLSGALSDVASSFIQNAKTAAGVQKGIALFQISVDTAQAISSLVKMSNGNPLNLLTGGAAGVIQFTTGLATILTNIAKAKQLLSAKQQFADGGLVRGPGGPKDDLIPALLSNGEGVMTAKAVQMFGPTLSAMNQAGGGKPFGPEIKSHFRSKFADGGLVSRTVSAPVMQGLSTTQLARAIASMPPPVLHLTELNKLSTQVNKTVAVSDH